VREDGGGSSGDGSDDDEMFDATEHAHSDAEVEPPPADRFVSAGGRRGGAGRGGA
jgi:hypothetical protein